MKIFVYGHVALDKIYHVDGRLDNKCVDVSQPLQAVPQAKTFLGGCAANVAACLAKLGADVYLVSSVGKDFDVGRLEEIGIDVKYIYQSNELTTRTWMYWNDKGEYQTYIYRGAEKDLDKCKKVKEDGWFHFSAGPPDFVLKRQQDLMSFDPAYDLRLWKKEELKQVLKKTQMLFFNEEEFRMLKKKVDEKDLQDKIVVCTKGAQGSEVYHDGIWRVSANKVDIKDPYGAGDAHTGTFLFYYLEGYDLARCLRLASQMAEYVIASDGPTSGLVSRDKLEEVG